jgi:hypothetical protein
VVEGVILIALLRVKVLVRIFAGPLLFGMLAALSLPSAAQGGPPFIGDDPGTPGDGNWEINVAAYTERHPTERIYNAPILDANYGLGPRIQLKYQVPYLVDGTERRPDSQRIGEVPGGREVALL